MRQTLFLLWVLLFAAVCAAPSAMGAGATTTGTPARTSPPVKVVAYYFHVTVRCVTCRAIEQYSREAIDQAFREELKKGVVEWKPINVQLPENRHYIQDYRLFTRSLVLVKMSGGKPIEWRNLEKVWELVGRKGDFFKYVQANVKTYLGGS